MEFKQGLARETMGKFGDQSQGDIFDILKFDNDFIKF